ncbi:hypothetical protein [Sediminibacterium sp.]|uniref:hypothetical protein n=1 Tax=Sediminibacterium sp. TaxID=1917865 RepID=UPI003F6EC9BF
MRSLNIVISLSVIIVITTVAVVYSKNHNQTLNTTSQEPVYITQAKKNIIGVWYQEDASTNIWEFKENGTLICRSDEEPAETFTYKIVNTTPICGQDVDVDEKRETMYLITKDADGIEECSDLAFHKNTSAKMNLWTIGMTADAITVFIKKSKTRVEKF